MSNVSDLKAALVAEAASISNEIERLECLTAIDEWYDCQVALARISAGTLSSYAVNGRSMTKRDIPAMRSHCERLYAGIKNHLYRESGGLIDMRGSGVDV